MLRLTCPYCGMRDEEEFRFGGQSHVPRPGLAATDEVWADYLFNRINPKGVHFERWLHGFGCDRWFNIARDTVTHEILAVYKMGDPKPVLEPSS
jgi:sarcosine oxidase, subunit delta